MLQSIISNEEIHVCCLIETLTFAQLTVTMLDKIVCLQYLPFI